MGNSAAGKIAHVLLIGAAMAGVIGFSPADGARSSLTASTAAAPNGDGFGWDVVGRSATYDEGAA